MDVFTVRKENLHRLILEKFDGSRAAFARASGVHQNQVNLILTENQLHRRNLGEALARKMEQALGLPERQLDALATIATDLGTSIAALPLDDTLRNALKPTTFLSTAALRSGWLEAFDSRITALENVGIAEIATEDMSPDLNIGDNVLIDTGATAVVVDGIYLLVRGEDAFIRRVQKQLSGGFTISADPSRHQPLTVKDMKPFKVLGRVLLAVGVRRV
jgi:hypothetical protein